jgi:phosphohistidine phosphatase SixA
VGHNPDVEQMTAVLVGDGPASVRFAKGSVAAIRFDEETPRAGEGTLLWHATAKLLGV